MAITSFTRNRTPTLPLEKDKSNTVNHQDPTTQRTSGLATRILTSPIPLLTEDLNVRTWKHAFEEGTSRLQNSEYRTLLKTARGEGPWTEAFDRWAAGEAYELVGELDLQEKTIAPKEGRVPTAVGIAMYNPKMPNNSSARYPDGTGGDTIALKTEKGDIRWSSSRSTDPLYTAQVDAYMQKYKKIITTFKVLAPVPTFPHTSNA